MVGVLLGAGAAGAHALLLEAVPAPGAVVPAVTEVRLRFSTRVEPRLGRLRLLDERGTARVLAVQGGGRPDELRAAVPALGPGAYRLEWQALSADGHVVRGTLSFRVAP